MKYMYILATPLLACIFNLLRFRRKKNRYSIGGMEGKYCDNSKYYYIYLVEKNKDVKWIAHSRLLYNKLNSYGLPVVYKYSFEGIYHMLTSHFHVTSCYKRETSYLLSIGSVYINLWHGLALKKIEYDIKSGPLASRYDKKNIIHHIYKIFMPNIMSKADYYVLPDSSCGEKMQKAFDIGNESVIFAPSPRLKKCKKFSSLDDAIRIIYMPTFRDEGGVDLGCWDKLDAELRKRNLKVDVKLHPFDSELPQFLEGLESFNILSVDDIYEHLPSYDLLISDYSSIFVDAMFLNIPVMLYVYDFEKYTSSSRELYFDFEFLSKNMTVSSNYLDLVLNIDNGNFINNEKLREYFWGNVDSNIDACKIINNQIKEL